MDSILKNRLRLKRVAVKVYDAAEWNFGHDPHYDWFDKLLAERDQLSETVRATDYEWWKEYDKVENDRGIKSLMVFLVPNCPTSKLSDSPLKLAEQFAASAGYSL